MEPNNIWTQIQEIKYPLIEPRKKSDFEQAIANFNDHVNNRGAIFFAVCRGKVSEGIDFADSKGRAVVITGLPFPPIADTKVILKKKFMDEEIDKDAKALTSDSSEYRPTTLRLSGDEWYQQQATRAVNQAAGRVIRHRRDYGAIIFCDERFVSPRNSAQLSLWIRQHLKIHESVEKVTTSLADFFERAQNDKSLQAKEVINLAPRTPDLPPSFYEQICAELLEFTKKETPDIPGDPFAAVEESGPFTETGGK